MLITAINLYAASVNDLTWEVVSGRVTFSDCNESALVAIGALVIPERINGHPVSIVGT